MIVVVTFCRTTHLKLNLLRAFCTLGKMMCLELWCVQWLYLRTFSALSTKKSVGRLDPESVQACKASKAMSWMSGEHLLHSLSLVEWLPLMRFPSSFSIRRLKKTWAPVGPESGTFTARPARAPNSSTSSVDEMCSDCSLLMKMGNVAGSLQQSSSTLPVQALKIQYIQFYQDAGKHAIFNMFASNHWEGQKNRCFRFEFWNHEDYEWVLLCRLLHTSRRCLRFHRQVFWEREMVGIL